MLPVEFTWWNPLVSTVFFATPSVNLLGFEVVVVVLSVVVVAMKLNVLTYNNQIILIF